MKKMVRTIVVIMILTFAISVLGCTNIATITRDVSRAVELGKAVAEISKTSDYNQALEDVEKLLHPKSNLDTDTIHAMIKENETIKSINFEGVTMDDVEFGNFSTPEFKLSNEELGGNVYDLHVVVTVQGIPLNVTLTLLSDDTGMGLYSFDIQQ